MGFWFRCEACNLGKFQLLTLTDAGVDTTETGDPEGNGLDLLRTRYTFRSLQHRWLIRNPLLDLQQDRGLPVVQLHDLVILHNGCSEFLQIVSLYGFDEDVQELAFACRRKGDIQAAVAAYVPSASDGVLSGSQRLRRSAKSWERTLIAKEQRPARSQ